MKPYAKFLKDVENVSYPMLVNSIQPASLIETLPFRPEFKQGTCYPIDKASHIIFYKGIGLNLDKIPSGSYEIVG